MKAPSTDYNMMNYWGVFDLILLVGVKYPPGFIRFAY